MKPKSLKRSRIMWGGGTALVTKMTGIYAALEADQEAVERIASAIGGEPWGLVALLCVGCLGDVAAMAARVHDHVTGRTA